MIQNNDINVNILYIYSDNQHNKSEENEIV